MTVANRIIQKLDLGGTLSGADIAALVNENLIPRERMIGLYNRYRCTDDQTWYAMGNSKPIFERSFDVDLVKVNNQINIDHYSNIIRTKTGYFIGEPITYSIDEDAPNKELAYEKLKDFLRRVDAPDMDTETAKFASMCGYGARLLYINPDGEADCMNLNPWEVIFLTKNGNIARPRYAIRYYKEQVEMVDGNYRDIMKAEFYDDKYVSFWEEATEPEYTPGTVDPQTVYNPSYAYGFLQVGEPQEHMFEGVPIVGFANNAELQGDAEKVLTIIDAVDRTVSDVNSEVEQFRLAYLAIYGYANIDDTFLQQLKKTGCLGFSEPTDKAEFITKNMDGTTIEAHLDRLEQAIYHISGIPDMRDEAFGGNSSGVALKFKIMPMENLCKMAENKFIAALRQQFYVLSSKWAVEAIAFDTDDLMFKFKRNFPLNLLDEATTAQALTGIVSQETVLGTLSIVKNPKDEMEKMKKEQQETVDLNAELYPELPMPGVNNGVQRATEGPEGQRQEEVEDE